MVLSGVLVVCVVILARGLRVDSDLGQFLPRTEDPIASLLIDELREGAAARGLLIAISGAPVERLASLSRQLRDRLSRDGRIRRIDNGSRMLDPELRDWLMEHRYRLVPLAPDALSAENLRHELHERLAELAGTPPCCARTKWRAIPPPPVSSRCAGLHRPSSGAPPRGVDELRRAARSALRGACARRLRDRSAAGAAGKHPRSIRCIGRRVAEAGDERSGRICGGRRANPSPRRP